MTFLSPLRKMSHPEVEQRIQNLEIKQQYLEEMKAQAIESFDDKLKPVIFEKKTLIYNNPLDLLEIIEKYSKAEGSMIKTKIAHTGVDRVFADILSTKIFGKPCKDIQPFEYESYGYGTDYNTLELKRKFHFKKIVFNGAVKLTPEELRILQKYEVEVVYCGY